MIRLILIFILTISLLNAKDNITKKIDNTNAKISSFSKNYTKINKKMAKNAKAIIRQKKEYAKQNEYLAALKQELKDKEKSYKSDTEQLKVLNGQQGTLKKEQTKIEEELVFVIAQSVSLSVIVEDENIVNDESLIEFEVLNNMLIESKKKAKELNEKFFTNAQDIDGLKKHTLVLEKAIASIDKKRKDLLKTQKSNKKALKTLTLAKSSYKKKVKKILNEQDTLKKTLSELNIIKIDKAKKAKEEKARRLAMENDEKQRVQVSQSDLPKVKKVGSSYQAVKTKKYSGKKTIAPLDSYTITKKYGTYTDPIYGIKIFNESISLKPKKSNAKVKTVFNGKVIYADKTAVLDNIVIVEHSNGLHTIYANLSQISPNIKKGSKIKKGYTIGRVSEELIFEVTQKSFHINPIRLFK